VHNTLILLLVVGGALIFDFTNRFHDTANSVAPTIATGALKPRVAVGLSALCNLIGAYLSLKVAATIASSVVDQTGVTLQVVLGGLAGAVLWNITTWYFSLPSSER
jgi:PiT family inorganic phosphate transporter